MKKISLLIALFVLFSFLCGFQKQQKQEKPLEHEVTVELVIVEVFVTDKQGNFVDNLTKDDFEIFEDGKKVKIQYFAVVTPEQVILGEKEVVEKAKEKVKPPIPQKMRLVILFDCINTNRFYLESQWPRIQEMFKALSDKVEETMIMELSREAGMRVIQPFTSEKNLLADGIHKFRVDKWKEVDQEARESLILDLQEAVRGGFMFSAGHIIEAIREEEKVIRRGRLADSFSAFLAAVNYIRRFEGIKSVLVVSDGLHLKKDIVRIFDPFGLFGGKKYFDQREAFEKFLELINEEKLIFYAFSPKPSVKTAFDPGQWARELYTLQEIAEETGGVHLRGQKKYENFIKELGRDLNYFYDISYAPPAKRKKEYHKIEVRVKKPGLKVRYRKGYSDFTEAEVEKRSLASAFLSPSIFKDISFSCKTDFVALRGSSAQFWIRLRIPLDQFRTDLDLETPENLALLFGINEWREKRVHTGGTTITIKEAVEKGSDILYRALITSLVNLKPGEYETRLILRQSGDQIGGWEASLKIPDMKKGNSSSIISSIFGFLRKEEKENTVPFSVSIGDGSLLLSRYRLYPSVENVFKERSKVALFVQIYCPKENKDFSLQFSLSEEDKMTTNLPFHKIESFFDKKLKVLSEVYLLDFQDVQPGDYQLMIGNSEKHLGKKMEVKIIS